MASKDLFARERELCLLFIKNKKKMMYLSIIQYQISRLT